MPLETREGFVPDHVQFGLHIRSEIARKPALQVAAKIAKKTNARVPFDADRRGRRGRRRHLKGSYVVVPERVRVGKYTRAAARVQSDLIQASTQEFGTSTQRPNRPLFRSAAEIAAEEGHDMRGDLADGGW